jgi:hypothetical protein
MKKLILTALAALILAPIAAAGNGNRPINDGNCEYLRDPFTGNYYLVCR